MIKETCPISDCCGTWATEKCQGERVKNLDIKPEVKPVEGGDVWLVCSQCGCRCTSSESREFDTHKPARKKLTTTGNMFEGVDDE